MSKQDRQGVRTAADLERKYNFERLNRSANQVMNISAETREAISKLSQEFRKELDDKLAGYVEESELADYAKADDLSGIRQDVHNNTQAITNQQKSIDSATRIANDASITANGVANDVNDHLAFEDGGTRIKGSFHAMLLPKGTDLDGVILPNRYIGGNVAENQYLNCPITTGTFFLSVEVCGDQGQLLQRLTYSHKTNGKTYERVFYTDAWGEWICVADYAGEALNAIQEELNAIEVALGEHMSSFAASIADTDYDVGAIRDSVDALGVRTQRLEGNVQSVSADLQGVINDLNDHFEFGDGGTQIKGAINPLLIPAGTDLDGLTIPNKYIGGTVTEYNYVNCPVPSGTFFLDVEMCGDQGQLKQILAYCNKTLGRTYERYYYGASWGEWVCVTDFVEIGKTAKLLWNEGVYYMTATQTVNLPEAISAQKNGILLVFSEYANGAASDSAIHSFFIHKEQVKLLPGKGYTFTLATSKLEYVGTKNVFIEDTKISGHADNNASGTGASGFKYTNNRFVLRYVFGI